MSKRTKTWLLVAIYLIVIGVVLFVLAGFIVGWDFKKFSTQKYQTNEHVITQEFNDISIETDVSDIILVPSDQGKKVVCYERERDNHLVEILDGVLKITLRKSQNLMDNISIMGENSTITLYLPKGEYGNLTIEASTSDILISKDFIFNGIDVSVSTGDIESKASAKGLIKISTTTGDIKIEEVSATAIDTSVSTGDVTVISVNCKNFNSQGSSGDLRLDGVLVEEKFFIKRNTGSVEFRDCDGGEIVVETSTGDVEGNLLSEKIFFVKTNTGDVDVPRTTTGGTCEITTRTGDIRIRI